MEIYRDVDQLRRIFAETIWNAHNVCDLDDNYDDDQSYVTYVS